jgi:hypothetical protein
MRHMRGLRLASAIALAFAGACTTAATVCNCPNVGAARVTLRADLQAMIKSATADSCKVVSAGAQGVDLSASAPGVCHVRIALANGQVFAAAVTFAPLGGCCGDLVVATDGSPPVLVDGGS